jgi:hypothetical protein
LALQALRLQSAVVEAPVVARQRRQGRLALLTMNAKGPPVVVAAAGVARNRRYLATAVRPEVPADGAPPSVVPQAAAPVLAWEAVVAAHCELQVRERQPAVVVVVAARATQEQ